MVFGLSSLWPSVVGFLGSGADLGFILFKVFADCRWCY